MTPFFTSLVLPLQQLDLGVLRSNGWVAGAAWGGPGVSSVSDRISSYSDTAAIEALLSESSRAHRTLDLTIGNLTVVCIEALARARDHTDAVGHLVLHLQTREGFREISALTQLGQVARPRRQASKDLLRAVYADAGVPSVAALEVSSQCMRGATLSLSAVTTDDDLGLVRWNGRSAIAGRLADLVVLRKDKSDVGIAFNLSPTRPTPNHVLAGSRDSMAAIRLTRVRDDHVERMRTQWLDAFLIELMQADEVGALAKELRSRARGASDTPWTELESAFLRWQTRSAWSASADHPMEAAISRLARHELGTDDLLDRVAQQLSTHADSDRRLAQSRLAYAVLALTVGSLATPILLYVAAGDLSRWFYVALLLNVVIMLGVAGLLFVKRRVR